MSTENEAVLVVAEWNGKRFPARVDPSYDVAVIVAGTRPVREASAAPRARHGVRWRRNQPGEGTFNLYGSTPRDPPGSHARLRKFWSFEVKN